MKRKLLILGFDGATFDLIEPFRKKGVLPHISQVLAEGASASLVSVIPPVSAPAWVSIVTGNNPGKHNIYGFTDGKGRMVNSTFRKSKAIWNLLDDSKKKSIIINLPVTYPPEEINGKIYAGILDPDEKVYRGRFQIDKESVTEKEKTLNKMVQWELSKTEKALKVMEETEWDLFFILYFLSDFVPTIYWKYMDTTHPQHVHDEVLSGAIENAYKVLDGILGRFLSVIDENTNVVIVSDHGMGSSTKVLNINEWLRREGFLSVKMATYEKTISPEKVAKFIDNHTLVKKIVNILPESVLKNAYRLVFSRSRNLFSRMNADSTQAYAYSHAHFASIWLLKRDEEVLSRIEDKIRTLKDPDTGEKVITRVYKRDHLYHGPWVDNAPDLIVEALPYCSIRSQRIGNLFSEPLQSGDHKMNGIFIAYGPDIQKRQLDKISIFHVCPTFLSLLGLPIPSEMDGKVLKEIFKKDFQIESKPVQSQRDVREHFYTEEEEEKIKKRLSALGYFD